MFLQGLGSLPKWPVSAHSEHVFFNLVSRKSDPETVTLLLYIRNSPRLHRSDLFLILHIRSSSAGNTPFPFLPRLQIPSPLFLSPRRKILQRLGVKSLVRFTSVSKQWKSTSNQHPLHTHLIRAQTRDPDILLGGEPLHGPKPYSYLRTLELGSSEFKQSNIMPKHDQRPCFITGSCDGLVCVYHVPNFIYLVNPATRWCRPLPKAKFQKINRIRRSLDSNNRCDFLGFGKDTMTGKHKMVWLYNSLELDLDGQTTCEVFDFATNTWRHVTGSTHRILLKAPVYLDGSIYWLTHKYNGETKIVYFDFHTEVFQVMAATPVVHASSYCIVIFRLNNHLCLSEKKINSQEIWSLNSHTIWEKTYNINLSLFGGLDFPVIPVTLISKTELLLFFPVCQLSLFNSAKNRFFVFFILQFCFWFLYSCSFHSKLDLYLVEDFKVIFHFFSNFFRCNTYY
ncbi:unnamed protein product [Brassica oleracea]